MMVNMVVPWLLALCHDASEFSYCLHNKETRLTRSQKNNSNNNTNLIQPALQICKEVILIQSIFALDLRIDSSDAVAIFLPAFENKTRLDIDETEYEEEEDEE